MDSKHFLLLSELFENFRKQALALLKEAEEFGFMDELTGCYNRKAYELRKEQLQETSIGVIFVDVNGLKYVNDTKGHEAGDLMLKDLGKMLKAYFGGNDVFRIGGDEFVILKPQIPKNVFVAMVKEFRLSIDANHKTTVAIGSCIDASLNVALTTAETLMYKDKAEFYEKYPEYKR